MVIRRMRADGLIVSAALVTIVLAIVLLAAGPIYADAVTVAGARRTLQDAPVSEANIAISQRVNATNFAAVDDQVTNEANRLLKTTGGEIGRSGRSEPYALPDEVLERIEVASGDDDRTRQTVFQFFDGIEIHATIVEGRWPELGSAGNAEVVLPEGGASTLGLAVGDEFEVRNRLDARLTIPVQVVGIYRAHDESDPYWYDDPLPVTGRESGESVVVIGPLVTDRGTFSSLVMQRLTDVIWRVLPDFERLQIDDIPALRGGLNGLPERLERANPGAATFQVTTGLRSLLTEIDQGLLAARSGVIILTLQLAILAGYALILTANLLADVRGVEMGLLRSRGAGVWQIAGFAMFEGLLLIVPAVLAGPWLAALSLSLLNVAGPLAAINLSLDPSVSSTSYLLAALAGLGCLLALTVPVMLSARSILGARAARGRAGEHSLWQRAGFDLALVAIAGLGLLQLRRFGSPLTETVRGRLELDPLLVAAPALSLLAGAILALRIVPFLGRVIEQMTTRGKSLVPVLGSWQISRRPSRYARSALLLMLALGIGLFAVSFSRTWNGSQLDQADFQVGAEIVVNPDRTGSSLSLQYLGAAYEGLDGVTSAMPVSSGAVSLPTGSASASAVQLDAARASQIVAYREDLAGQPLSDLMAPLADARPEIAGIPIPGEPRRIALDVHSTMSSICDERLQCLEHGSLTPAQLRRFDVPLTPAIIVQDARSQFYRFGAPPLTSSNETQRITFDLARTAGDQEITPEYPVQVVEIELETVRAPGGLRKTGKFGLREILVSESGAGGERVWTAVDVVAEGLEWEFMPGPVQGNFSASPAVRITEDPDSSLLDLELNPGAGGVGSPASLTNIEFSMRLEQRPSEEPIPIITSEDLLVNIAFGEMSEFRLLLAGTERPVTITGTVEAFPTVDPDEDAIVITDGPTLDALQYIEAGNISTSFDAWWLDVESGATDEVARALETAPFESNEIVTRDAVAESLQTDPVALGTVGALSLGFGAAAVFAVIGFASSIVVGIRERMSEFALLRSIGLSPRELAAWILIENGFLVVVSLLGGTLLGVLLAWLILPLITVTREAEQVFPELIVVIPWRTIAMLEGFVLATLIAVSLTMAVFLRRVGLGSALRIGEE